MRKNKKLKMIFDATIIASGISKNSNRSGIFFVAINVLKEFIKSEKFEIIFYTPSYCYEDVISVLNNYFDTKFNIITDKPDSNNHKLYKQLKEIKNFTKSNKMYLLFEKIDYKLRIARFNRFDIFFSPLFKIPDIFMSKRLKKYYISYDLIPLINSTVRLNDGSDKWFFDLLESYNRESYIFTISEHTKNDLVTNCKNIDPENVKTTLLACDKSFKQASTENVYKTKDKYNIPIDKKYVFSLCTLEPRKNLISAVITFIEFIKKHNINDMVCGHWGPFLEELNKHIDDLGVYQDKILKIGYVDDEDLAPLYSGAEWFVYTSQYEGFGLPPLEAMSCGCPVITSNNSSLPEVVGDAGIMIDWDSDEQHIQAYEKYYYDENYRKEMAQKGLERSKQFSWEKCANQMIEVMERNV